ncbi:hypothetical protein BOX15_Mlig032164g2 [Macrostomum lignano]|uniref:WW domain-containing protein n=1 Tax=Macrostomum lignano TaxID=282301 RepID=A0A267DW21_9PLAT|nr:hypothetical protein BOX15_Mlig032164g2 [Macrostomum lignano]
MATDAPPSTAAETPASGQAEQQPPLLSAVDPSASSSTTTSPPPLAPIRTERHPSSSSTASSFDSTCVTSPLTPGGAPGAPFRSPGAAGFGATGGGAAGVGGSGATSHDLSEELLAAGWRKFWSKRENRPYYFNKLTNQSLWEPPTAALPGVKRTLSDPAAAVPNHHHQHHQQGPSAPKRPSFGGPQALDAAWNFSVHSNCVTLERPPRRLFQPHPETELLRAQLIAKLRQHYSELCVSRENIQPPPDSFNRWLIERYLSDKGSDPLFPSDCDNELSYALFREIINDLPVRLCRPKLSADAKKQLYRYAEASKAMIESRVANPESRKIVKWNVEQTYQFLRQAKMPTYEDCLERLAHLKRTCQPHIEEAAKESVEKICTKLYHLSVEYAKKVRELQETLFKVTNPTDPWADLPPWSGDPKRRVRCYPVQICSPAPRPAAQQQLVETGCTDRMQFVRYGRDNSSQQGICRSVFAKLQQLYTLHCTEEDPSMEKFFPRLWCMLTRYQAFLGQQSQNTQAALPIPVFEAISRLFGVTFELFASPLNCYFKQYCSAFPDTDCYFGSRGPVLDFYPLEGSFEANPPFSEELMVAMVNHMENLLKEATGPLSFMVFLPDWRDPPTEALVRLEASPYNRRQTCVLPFEHSYRNGMQHCLERDEDLYVKSAHGTLIVFLQNDAGFMKWTPTSEKIKDLLIAFGQQSSHRRPQPQ